MLPINKTRGLSPEPRPQVAKKDITVKWKTAKTYSYGAPKDPQQPNLLSHSGVWNPTGGDSSAEPAKNKNLQRNKKLQIVKGSETPFEGKSPLRYYRDEFGYTVIDHIVTNKPSYERPPTNQERLVGDTFRKSIEKAMQETDQNIRDGEFLGGYSIVRGRLFHRKRSEY